MKHIDKDPRKRFNSVMFFFSIRIFVRISLAPILVPCRERERLCRTRSDWIRRPRVEQRGPISRGGCWRALPIASQSASSRSSIASGSIWWWMTDTGNANPDTRTDWVFRPCITGACAQNHSRIFIIHFLIRRYWFFVIDEIVRMRGCRRRCRRQHRRCGGRWPGSLGLLPTDLLLLLLLLLRRIDTGLTVVTICRLTIRTNALLLLLLLLLLLVRHTDRTRSCCTCGYRLMGAGRSPHFPSNLGSRISISVLFGSRRVRISARRSESVLTSAQTPTRWSSWAHRTNASSSATCTTCAKGASRTVLAAVLFCFQTKRRNAATHDRTWFRWSGCSMMSTVNGRSVRMRCRWCGIRTRRSGSCHRWTTYTETGTHTWQHRRSRLTDGHRHSANVTTSYRSSTSVEAIHRCHLSVMMMMRRARHHWTQWINPSEILAAEWRRYLGRPVVIWTVRAVHHVNVGATCYETVETSCAKSCFEFSGCRCSYVGSVALALSVLCSSVFEPNLQHEEKGSLR